MKHFKINATGNGFSDQLLINFNASSTNGYDDDYDAFKLMGSAKAPQIYTTMEGSNLTLNSLPAKSYMQIPMGFETEVEEKYSIDAEGLESISNIENIYLEDKQLDKMTSLMDKPSIWFHISP